jgi:hypothetical protein
MLTFGVLPGAGKRFDLRAYIEVRKFRRLVPERAIRCGEGPRLTVAASA